MRSVLVLLCLWMLSDEVGAQKEFHFENFTTRDGLSNNEVRALLRDQKGFLWVGTANGLNRFDGYSFQTFLPQHNNPNSIKGSAISTLAEDSQGRIWMVHNRGLEVYDPARDTFLWQPITNIDDELGRAFLHGCKLYIDQKDRVFLANERPHIWHWDSKTEQLRKITPPEVPIEQRPLIGQQAEYNIIFGITRKSDTEVWLNSTYGIFSFHTDTEQFTHYPLEGYDSDEAPGFLLQDEEREWVWFSSFAHAFYALNYRTGELKKWDYPPFYSMITGLQIGFVEKNKIWLSTPGILDIATNTFQPIQHISDDRYSFPDAPVAVFYRDREGIMWIGTTAGLTKFDPILQAFRHVQVESHPRDKYDNSIFNIYQPPGSPQAFITSFYHEHLYTYNFETGKSGIIPSTSERPLVATTRIFKDSYGIHWLLAHSHIYQVDLEKQLFESVPLPPLPEDVNDRVITDVAEDVHGNLWFAKWRAGVLFYDRKTEQLRYIADELPALFTRFPFYIQASNSKQLIWISTQSEGILGYNVSSQEVLYLDTLITSQEDFIVDNSNGLEVDEQDNLWIATNNGLARRDADGVVRVFTTRDGFASDYFEGIGKDLKGRIWLTSSEGISCIDPETFAIRNFDERHGIRMDGPLRHFSVSPNGELFIGTAQGFIRFHPDSIQVDTRPPKVVITAFKVNGTAFKPDSLVAEYCSEIQLKPRENFFTIEFAALNFTLPEENTFFYQLEGVDADWKEADANRTTTYTKVPPGTYKFRLKAKNKDDVWSAVEKTLTIIVQPPFWKTKWFMALMVFTIGGIVLGGYRFRISQVRQREQLKAAFEKKLAEVEMTALRSQMNPHFLFNCLNSINRFIQCNEPDAASAYLTKFSRLVRLVLDNSRTNTVTLRDELEALRLYLELESMRFVGRFKYVIDVSHELDKTSIDVPPMLIQPYVENAIWHGLMHKESDDCQLILRAYAKAMRLIIEVEDNGIGRAAARELKSKSATLHKSHGMKVTAERIDMINELYQTKASVEILDLTDAEGRAAGTKVILSLPL